MTSKKGVLVTFGIIVLVIAASYLGVDYYTAQPAFCGGSCHAMTEQYDAWKRDKHHASNNESGKQADCINCHFLPGEHRSIKAKLEGLRHLAAYLYDPKAPLPIRPKIPDGACMQAGCHDSDTFKTKEIQYTEKARFKHEVHLGEKALEGNRISCDTCHFKVTEEKHFEVPQEICFLCHLKLDKPDLKKAVMRQAVMQPGEIQRVSFQQDPKIEFNEGRSKCSICHEIPTRSLQAQKTVENPDDKPITHQTLQARGVPCESCHFEVIKGHGEINTGNVVSNGCLRCHNTSASLIEAAQDKSRMHGAHIDSANADCFDCHTVVEHKHRDDHLDFVREDCKLCHDNQHRYQFMLLAGVPVADIPETPQLMAGVNTNCMACHIKKTERKGHLIRTGSGEACVACHTKEHDTMLKTWNTDVDGELKAAEELEKEVSEALKKAETEGSIPKEKLDEARARWAVGAEYLNVIRFGNGVHNKKYAVLLIDQAFARFDEATALIEGG